MVNVNAKMKETLDEVGRSSDKLCVDIMCIVSAFFLAYARYLMWFLSSSVVCFPFIIFSF